MKKEYLGDSVYVEIDEDDGIILTTWNGYEDDPRNIIYMEPKVVRALLAYVYRQDLKVNL
jgi:hypothetical protein